MIESMDNPVLLKVTSMDHMELLVGCRLCNPNQDLDGDVSENPLFVLSPKRDLEARNKHKVHAYMCA
jgi:hypothetical protein